SNPYALASSASRIMVLVQAVSTSATPTVNLYVGGTADAHLTLPGSSGGSTVTTHTCTIDNDTQSAVPLIVAQFSGHCVIPTAATIVEVDVIGGTQVVTGTPTSISPSGTSSVQIGKYSPDGGAHTTALMSALLPTASGKACALTTTSGTCLNGLTSS